MRTNSHSPVLEPEAIVEARLLDEVLEPFDGDLEVRHALGWLHWLRHEALDSEESTTERAKAAEMFLPCFLFGEDNVPAPLLVELAEQAAPGASRALRRAADSGDAELSSRTAVLWRAIVKALPEDHRLRGIALSSLGHALLLRHGHTREPGDLDESIAAGREALTHPAEVVERSGFLHNLGLALQVRFEETNDQASLVESVAAHRDAVAITPPDSPFRTVVLSGLATAMVTAQDRFADPEHLSATIDMLRAVLADTADDDPHRGGRLSNLALTFHKRYDLLEDPEDLQEAVHAARGAIEVTGQDDGRLPGYLTTLADVLHGRFEHTGDSSDVDEAVVVARRAVALTPPGHPQSAGRLLSLANALRCQARGTDDEDGMRQAALIYADAAHVVTAPPSHRVRAARNAAALLARTEPRRAAGLLEMAVRLLPAVTPRELERHDHRHVFDDLTNLAGDAAALALSDDSVPEEQRALRALRLLETGRAVVLGRQFDLRGELADLHRRHPELATRFTTARDLLDRPPVPYTIGPDRHLLADALESVLAEIRGLPGFGSFGLPPDLSDLLVEGGRGPVVVFNTSVHRCDALLITGEGVRAVPLSGMTLEALIENFRTFYDALHTPDEAVVLPRVLSWLWDKAVDPVFAALGYDRGHDGVRRLWWAPGGILGLLPLHAAGHHTDPRDDPDRRTVLDRVVSSYTPSVRALRHARTRTTEKSLRNRALIVAMPTTPGAAGGSLPAAAAEAEVVRRLVPESVLLAEHDDIGGAVGGPTKNNVLKILPECTIAHFICHGWANHLDPSQSVLLLRDHQTDPLTVATLDQIQLGSAHIVYLSACATAVVHHRALIDEATHLASAFQLAGFPHVVGTLWEVRDRPAVRVAEKFYATLTADQEHPSPALALHAAVRAARDRYPHRPSAWASHQHFGA